MNKTPLTVAGAEKLRAELHRLKTVERPNVIAAIAEARSHGDLSENAEYEAAKDEQRIPNRAGFYRTDENGAREFMVLPEAYRREVCQGFDPKVVTAELVKAGWLQPGKDGRAAQKPRLPGLGPTRCYVFTGRLWEDEPCV